MQPKISVIIPVYNAASTIERCAHSLFCQTMTKDVEFLFVNDNSPDNSIEVLEQVIDCYPQIKEQIRVVNNPENLGVLETRKRGLREARGQYVAWVDSDDWIEPVMLETMWKCSNNGIVDIVVQNVFVDNYKNGNLKSTREWKLYPELDAKHALYKYHTDKHVPWGLPFQMSRRNLILDASKRVHDVIITEDTIMLIYLFAIAKSCVWLEKPFYHYVCEDKSSSLTHSNYQTKEEWNCQVKNIDDVTAFLMSKDKVGYRITASYIKWLWKKRFVGSFDSCWSYWRKYNECYRDILKFYNGKISALKKIKVWLTYNIYPLYWYKVGRHHF